MNILMIGAHPDDVEIGCGGTTYMLLNDHRIYWMVMTCGDYIKTNRVTRIREQKRSSDYIPQVELLQENFSDNFLNSSVNSMINVIEKRIEEYGIDMIFTNSKHDTHHDHKAVYEASIEAGRKLDNIVSYEEIMSPNFKPNLFVNISDYIEEKIKLIQNHESQKGKICLNPQAIKALAMHRSAQLNQEEAYCEAFEVYKMSLTIWS